MPWSSGSNHTLALNDAMFDGSNGCGLCVKYRGTGSGIGTTPLSTTQWYTGFVNNRCVWRPRSSSRAARWTLHLHAEVSFKSWWCQLVPPVSRFSVVTRWCPAGHARCPECAYGSLDINANGDGRWGVEWYAVPCPVGDSTMRYDIVVSSYYWFSMIVSNTRHAPVVFCPSLGACMRRPGCHFITMLSCHMHHGSACTLV